MNKIINIWNGFSVGKKVYTILWIIFCVLLVTIVLTSSLSTNSDAIAGVSLAFLISLISSIFTTVIVNLRESKKKKTGDK